MDAQLTLFHVESSVTGNKVKPYDNPEELVTKCVSIDYVENITCSQILILHVTS